VVSFRWHRTVFFKLIKHFLSFVFSVKLDPRMLFQCFDIVFFTWPLQEYLHNVKK
jgi:hypothetical protein